MHVRSLDWILFAAPLSLLIGCSSGVCVFEPAEDGFACPAPADADAGTPAEDLPACTTVWDGSYTCPQGLTQLTLSISHDPATNQLTALFSFTAPSPDANTAGASGCFTMVGEYDPASRAVSLRGDEWICHPPLYFTVDLEGTFEPDRPALVGHVGTAGCTTFDVTQRTGL